MSGPWVLTMFDSDVAGMFDDIDEWLDQEDCACEGLCTCEEER